MQVFFAGQFTPFQILFDDELLMRSLLKKGLILAPEPIFPPFMTTFRKDNANKSSRLTCFLITSKTKVSGFLALEVPSDKDILKGNEYHLLGSLSNFLGGAIEYARMNQTIQTHREELKRLTARLLVQMCYP